MINYKKYYRNAFTHSLTNLFHSTINIIAPTYMSAFITPLFLLNNRPEVRVKDIPHKVSIQMTRQQ